MFAIESGFRVERFTMGREEQQPQVQVAHWDYLQDIGMSRDDSLQLINCLRTRRALAVLMEENGQVTLTDATMLFATL